MQSIAAVNCSRHQQNVAQPCHGIPIAPRPVLLCQVYNHLALLSEVLPKTRPAQIIPLALHPQIIESVHVGEPVTDSGAETCTIKTTIYSYELQVLGDFQSVTDIISAAMA